MQKKGGHGETWRMQEREFAWVCAKEKWKKAWEVDHEKIWKCAHSGHEWKLSGLESVTISF